MVLLSSIWKTIKSWKDGKNDDFWNRLENYFQLVSWSQKCHKRKQMSNSQISSHSSVSWRLPMAKLIIGVSKGCLYGRLNGFIGALPKREVLCCMGLLKYICIHWTICFLSSSVLVLEFHKVTFMSYFISTDHSKCLETWQTVIFPLIQFILRIILHTTCLLLAARLVCWPHQQKN